MEEFTIVNIKHLTKKPSNTKAKEILVNLARDTSALLKRKKWKVKTLAEFYPKNQGLLGLNVNRGFKIMVRLRSSSDEKSFLPYESILGTFIHELVHIEISSHSFEFYSLVEALEVEIQKDITLGLTNKFHNKFLWDDSGKANILGGKKQKLLSNRDLYASAIENRIENNPNFNISGKKIGGEIDKFRFLDKVEAQMKITHSKTFNNISAKTNIYCQEIQEKGAGCFSLTQEEIDEISNQLDEEDDLNQESTRCDAQAHGQNKIIPYSTQSSSSVLNHQSTSSTLSKNGNIEIIDLTDES